MPLQVFASDSIIYVSNESGNDGNSGTSEAPVKTIERALELVEEGGTIQIVDSTSSAQPSEDEPLVITKSITITGGELTLSKAGIMLGADVMFQDVSLNFTNPVRNAIIANGYELRLNNLVGSGAFPVHLFCGGITGYTGSVTLPDAGNSGEILILGEGNHLGNIFAGSLSEYGVENIWNGTSEIKIAANAGGTIGNAYAHGAMEPRDGSNGTGMVPDASQYIVTGNVYIHLSGSKPMEVYGMTGGERNANLVVNGGSYAMTGIVLDNLASLTVNSGVFQPVVLNAGIDVAINYGAELDLSDVIADGTVFNVGDFIGGGGIFAMGQTDMLRITGMVTGETEFQTTTNRPIDKSTSGLVEYSYKYIDVTNATGDGTFTFIPDTGQNGAFFEKVTEDDGSIIWEVFEPEEYPVVKPNSFTISNTSYNMTMEEVLQSEILKVPVNCELSEDEWLFDVPLNVTISKDGGESIEALESYGYGYTYSVADLGFEEIFCDYGDGDEWCIYFYLDSSLIKEGEYNVNFSVMLSDDSVAASTITFTINDTIVPVITGALAGYSLSLEGNIGVNFYMELDESVLSDEAAYMQFTLGGKELLAVMVSDVKESTAEVNGKTYYIFKCGVPVKDMQTEITAQLILGNGSRGTLYTYTVREYADYILNPENGYDDVTIALVNAMLNYGDYAKAYFAGETLAATEVTEAVTADTLREFEGNIKGTELNDTADMYYGSSLLLKSETILRLYFTEEVEGSIKKGDLYCIDIPNIAAHELHKNIETEVDGIIITYSPLSYAYQVLNSESAEDSLKNLMKAMYLYHQAAKAYVNVY